MIENYKEFIDKCTHIVKSKNHDYSKNDSAFSNFSKATDIGLTVEQGILVRCMDKVARIENIQEKGQQKVKDESIKDTYRDLANYLMILRAYYEYQPEHELVSSKQLIENISNGYNDLFARYMPNARHDITVKEIYQTIKDIYYSNNTVSTVNINYLVLKIADKYNKHRESNYDISKRK